MANTVLDHVYPAVGTSLKSSLAAPLLRSLLSLSSAAQPVSDHQWWVQVPLNTVSDAAAGTSSRHKYHHVVNTVLDHVYPAIGTSQGSCLQQHDTASIQGCQRHSPTSTNPTMSHPAVNTVSHHVYPAVGTSPPCLIQR